MKKIIMIIISALFVLYACDKPTVDDCESWDGEGCLPYRPDSGLLIVKLTINKENDNVLVKVFKGKLEEEQEIMKVNTFDALLHLYLPVNTYYTVMASYKSGDKSILAVDADEIKLKEYIVCGENCYVLKDGEVNVRLKR